jgi:beta-aspartyl-peptidase (threonine type)
MSAALLVHGGAGAIGAADPTRLATARAGLARALAAGARALADGAPALAAAEAAVRALEDDPAFNAGRGSALTRAGTVEMDAAVMDGSTGAAGAVACVGGLRHPVHAARLVLERTPHVLLVGPAARLFAVEAGAEACAEDELVTERARADLARALARADAALRGTVGAVARDRDGRLAAATSTGGLSGKRCGRVGDSPLIGSGTWADRRCAISATGDGELFIRTAFAHRVASAISHGALSAAAAEAALAAVARMGGGGGCLVLGRDGDGSAHQAADMFRGAWSPGAGARVAVLGGEPLAPA